MGRIDKELLNYHSKYSKDGVLFQSILEKKNVVKKSNNK